MPIPSPARIAAPLALAAVLVIPSALAAQGVPVKTLGKPDAEFSEPFTLMSGLRELRNGRVVVADARDKTLQIISFDGDAKKIGREGSGPGEYGLPMRVLAAPGDTTLVYDPLNARYLVVSPDGTPVTTFTLGGAERGGIRATMAPQGTDSRGRFFFRSLGLTQNGDGPPKQADSLPITRYDRATKRTDTLTYVPNDAKVQISGSQAAGNMSVSIRTGAGPFGGSDAWVPLPDGRVAVIRFKDYHVDFYGNGRTISGPAVPFERIKVTEADKKAWRDARGRSGAVAFSTTRSSGAGSGGGDQRSMRVAGATLNAPEPEWPEYKGAFINASAAPDGRVWVQRNVKAGDPVMYDVFDGNGRLVQRVVLPQRTRLVGFGNGSVYLARSDEDDLQFLQRYKM